jgi:hypothetical protein
MIIFDICEIKILRSFAYEKFHDHTSLRVVTYLYIAWEELGSSRGKKHKKKLKLSFLVDVVFHEKKPLSPHLAAAGGTTGRATSVLNTDNRI